MGRAVGTPDRDHRSAAEDTPEGLLALWRGAVARSRAIVDAALGAGGPDQLGAYTTRSGERPNLRRILLDLIEEYARHAGRADLIRESVDGLAGEDPPR
ncbi:mycothiol transferase [Streptomyces virginiae]